MRLYGVNYNLDYEEAAFVFRSREELAAHIAVTFEINQDLEEGETPIKLDGQAFWDEVHDIYGLGKWKGLNVFYFDTDDPHMKTYDLPPKHEEPPL